VTRAFALFIALLGLGLLVRAQAFLHVDSGDASGGYTDHLRHMGEALILSSDGFAVYRQPYGERIRAQGLDPIHLGLFPERTAPYPPLGILVHWPLAVMDRAAVITAPAAHRAMVWVWTLVALGACAVVLRLVDDRLAQVWALALAVPLLVGMGINGFFDAGYLLCGAIACVAWKRSQHRAVVFWLCLAAALHFRAAVFAPLGAAALWQVRRDRLAWMPLLLLVPSFAAAVALLGTFDTIPPHNPVHWSHVKGALLGFSALTAAAVAWLVREGRRGAEAEGPPVHPARHQAAGVGGGSSLDFSRDERTPSSAPPTSLTQGLVALTLTTAFALTVMERSHGWWHAGTLLAPGLLLAATRPRWQTWGVLLAWTIGSSFLAYRHPASVFWTWVPFAVGGL